MRLWLCVIIGNNVGFVSNLNGNFEPTCDAGELIVGDEIATVCGVYAISFTSAYWDYNFFLILAHTLYTRHPSYTA